MLLPLVICSVVVASARADTQNVNAAVYGYAPAVKPDIRRAWTFQQPLRVCFVSLLDFSGRCNGSPEPEWESSVQPEGGWCENGQDFCGYDVDVWRCAA